MRAARTFSLSVYGRLVARAARSGRRWEKIARRKTIEHVMKRNGRNASMKRSERKPEMKTPRADFAGGAQSFTVDILHNARVGAQGQIRNARYARKSYDNVSANCGSRCSKRC